MLPGLVGEDLVMQLISPPACFSLTHIDKIGEQDSCTNYHSKYMFLTYHSNMNFLTSSDGLLHEDVFGQSKADYLSSVLLGLVWEGLCQHELNVQPGLVWVDLCEHKLNYLRTRERNCCDLSN